MASLEFALPQGYALQEYRIESMLGTGGFSLTYLATDTNLNLKVALKEYLPAELAVRDVDHSERELVKRSGMRVFTMKEIDKRGIGTVLDEAFSIVTRNTDGFSCTLDADFLDPMESPGVATPVRGGANYREAHLAMEMIADTRKLVSFEITEINPILDEHNKTAHFGAELILSAFGKQIL